MLVTEWVFKLLCYTVTRVLLLKIREVGQNALPRSLLGVFVLSLHDKDVKLKENKLMVQEKRQFASER